MLAIIGAIALASGIYFWMGSTEEKPLVGCEKKEVKSAECDERNPDACVYTFTDKSMDVQEKGHKKGDVLDVCRGEIPPK